MTNELDRLSSTMNSVFGPAEPGAELVGPLLRLLAHGEPVPVDVLATTTGRGSEDVRRMLAVMRDTEYDAQGRIVGYGITLRPTPHHFEVEGRRLYTWCALDTLAFPAILGRTAHVESPCRSTGTPIRATVTPDAVVHIEPVTAVVSVVMPDDVTSIRSAFCDHVHFFTSEQAAQPWRDEHPGGSLLPVADAQRIASRCC